MPAGGSGRAAWAVALGLLLGGALGNLVDRLVREPGIARGDVVDFIAYANWFVGNVADIAIVVAAVLVVILAALGVHIDGTRDGHGGADRAGREHGPDDGADEPRTTRTARRRASAPERRTPAPTTTEQNA